MAGRVSILRNSMLRLTGSVLSAVLTALGATSCGGTANDPSSPCYGVPSVEFSVTGSTYSSQDSTAISGIRVTLSEIASSDTSVVDSSFTTVSGLYEFSYIQEGAVYYDDYYLYIRADDVDSILNGLFFSKDTLIPITADSVSDGAVNISGLDFYLQPEHGR
jgi:putative lipoprotein (rSAM/lipoprotein system)